MRILVTGSRDWSAWNVVNDALNSYGGKSNITVVHGACPTGADAMADHWAAYQGVRCERHPADWKTHGRKAGPIRNAEMVALGADVCLAFISRCTSPRCIRSDLHPSHGASGTADLAEGAGIETRRFAPT